MGHSTIVPPPASNVITNITIVFAVIFVVVFSFTFAGETIKYNVRKRYNFQVKLRLSDLLVDLYWNTTEKAKNAYIKVLLLLNRN